MKNIWIAYIGTLILFVRNGQEQKKQNGRSNFATMQILYYFLFKKICFLFQ